MTYLDYAATTPLASEALAAMQPYLTDLFANPASDHGPGRAAKKAVEAARAQVAALIGATAEEIIWTSGATEANNLAIKGALEFRGLDKAHLITSKTEHKCVLDTCRHLESQHGARGLRVTYLKPGPDGCVRAQQVIEALTPQTVLVSLMWVSNELGTINEIEQLAPLLRERGVLLHVDAVQAAGKLAIDLASTPIDLLSLSAHKIYGPKGIGALWIRDAIALAPLLHGGDQENGRSGTLSPALCAGFGTAATLMRDRVDADAVHVDRLWTINGATDPRYRGNLNVRRAGLDVARLMSDCRDIAFSAGSACASGSGRSSHVLRALGLSEAEARSSIRLGWGRYTDAAEFTRALERLVAAASLQ